MIRKRLITRFGVWLLATAFVVAGRGSLAVLEAGRRRRGTSGLPTLVVGAGRVGHLVVRRLKERPGFGLDPVAFFDRDPLVIDTEFRLPVLGSEIEDADDPTLFSSSLTDAVRDLGIKHVIVAFSRSSHEIELQLARRCQELGVGVSVVPRLFGGVPDHVEVQRLGGLPLLSVRSSDPRGYPFAIKYAVDRIFAVLAIALLWPLMAASALAILVTMRRPILFRQQRVGIDGTEFELVKFRTMTGTSNGDGPTRSTLEDGLAPGGEEGEGRRTPVGALLRRTSLDELPQLLNVVRGEMSLIGPRPERPEFAHLFDLHVDGYADRSRVRSGITGWAQVHGLRGRTSVADRAEWDNYYIENWSPWLDLKIVLLTVPALFRHAGE